MGYYKIADIIFKIENIDYELFHTRMKEYKIEYIPDDVDVTVLYNENNCISVPYGEAIPGKNNKFWIHNDNEYVLYDYYEEYDKVFTCVKANGDWSKVEYTIADATEIFGIPNDVRCFNMLSIVMQNVILFKNGMVIHSSAIDFKENGLAFFAPSGTGKSTHTSLWKKYYPDDVEIINDDSPVVRLINDKIMMYGTPWSGKTNINTNKSVELKAVVFLRQAYENSISKVVNPLEALQVILPEVYKPVFEEMINLNMDMLDKLIKNVPMYIMYCNISKEAVDIVKKTIIK